MAEKGSNQLARPQDAATALALKTPADLKREIAEIRSRISASIASAERRAAALAGVEDFDHIPTGWRGLAFAAGRIVQSLRGRGFAGRRAVMIGGLIGAALIAAAFRRRRPRRSP